MKINNKTLLYGLIGHPIFQSLSPLIQNKAFQYFNCESVYLAFDVINLKEAILGIKALNIRGVSVTIPYKTDIIKYLDWLEPNAKKMNAVNTVINDNSYLKGYNTDGEGAYELILEKFYKLNLEISKKTVLIIGNGGTARSLAYILSKKNQDQKIIILSRSKSKLDNFSAWFKQKCNSNKIEIFTSDSDPYFIELFKTVGLIFNATPIGMHPNDKDSPISLDLISKEHIVFDAVYSPIITKLLKTAKLKKAETINGIELLISQGVLQFELWTGIKKSRKIMKKEIIKFLYNKLAVQGFEPRTFGL